MCKGFNLAAYSTNGISDKTINTYYPKIMCGILVLVVGMCAAHADESMYAAVQRLSPGPGPASAKLWARYLPHHVTPGMMSQEEDESDFIDNARALAIELGFNATSNSCVYEGEGAKKHLGPLFTQGPLWANGNDYLMQDTKPDFLRARLLPATIYNIDSNRNLLCPCAVGTCKDAGDKMPNFCIPVTEATSSTGELNDQLLIVLAVMIIIAGTVMALVAG